MTDPLLPEVAKKKYSKPSEILFNGYGLTMYRSGQVVDGKYFVVIGSSIAEGVPDVTAKGRLLKSGLAVTHAMLAMVWGFYMTMIFLLTTLFSLLIAGETSAAYHPAVLLVQGVFATMMMMKTTTGSFLPRNYMGNARNFLVPVQLVAEIQSSKLNTKVIEVSLPIAEIVGKLLEIDIVDKPMLVDVVARKLVSSATDQEKFDWTRNVASIFTFQPELPASYIPLLNDDAELLEREVRLKAQAALAEKNRAILEEKTIFDEVTQERDEIDSSSSLTGALTFLGIDEETANARKAMKDRKAAELAASSDHRHIADPAPHYSDVRFKEASEMLGKVLEETNHDKKYVSDSIIPSLLRMMNGDKDATAEFLRLEGFGHLIPEVMEMETYVVVNSKLRKAGPKLPDTGRTITYGGSRKR